MRTMFTIFPSYESILICTYTEIKSCGTSSSKTDKFWATSPRRLPEIVTSVPPACGPYVGSTDVTMGV